MIEESEVLKELKTELDEDKEKLTKLKTSTSSHNKKLRVAIYCRVSTVADSQQSSFSNQEFGLKEIVENREDWTWVKTFGDNGKSGTSINRKSFVELLKFCGIDSKTKEIISESSCDLIIVKNTSRFARNVGDSDAILKALAKNSVDVFFLDLGKLASEDTILVQILSVMDENESRDKSKKIRYGLQVAANQNRVRTNGKLYGYDYDKINKKLIKNEEQAKIVALIFKFYSTGKYGVRKLSNMLNNGDFGKIPDGKKVFSTSSLKKMLQNEKYAGLNNALKWSTGTIFMDKHSPQVKKDYNLVRCDNIEAIVSEDIFFKCQEIMSDKVTHFKTDHTKFVGKNTGTSRFGGKITCGNCGNNYIRNVDNGRKFYNCSLKKKAGVKACNSANTTDDELVKLLMSEAVKWHILMTTNLQWYVEKCLDYLIKLYSDDDKFENDIENMSNELKRAKFEYQKFQKMIMMMGGIEEATDDDIRTLKELRQKVIVCEKDFNKNSDNGRRLATKKWLCACREKIKESIYRDIGVDELIDICEKVVIHTDSEKNKTVEFFYSENFNLLSELDDKVNGFRLDDFPCCRLFTRVKNYDFALKWLAKNENIDYNIIDKLNSEKITFEDLS